MPHRSPAASSKGRNGRPRVGRYELLAEIGRGGMGVVFRARDITLGRDVALKRPLAEGRSDPRARRRFMHEARAAARLSHAGIVPIFEVFEDGDTPWIAMQLVEGPTLAGELAGGRPLPMGRALRHAEELAEALHAAHEQRILHRDLKPSNIFIGPDGHALLSDFGLARFLPPPGDRSSAAPSSATTLTGPPTAAGTVVGTRGYMSPEQSLGHAVDIRSDIFSLGAVLYEMCTGRCAFSAPSHEELLDAVLHGEPTPIARLNYEVPADFESAIRKCLAKPPDERYQDTRDLLADLRAARRRFEHRSYEKDHPAPPRPAPRRWMAWTAAGLVALAILVGAALMRREPPAPAAPRSHVLGVSAFQNLEGDPRLDILARGMTETLLARLSGLEGFYVLPTGDDTGAEMVLQGGVQGAGDSVRVTWRLIHRRENRTLGGDVATGAARDLFTLQDEVALRVADILSRETGLPPTLRSPRSPTLDVTAYDLYLRGRDALQESQDPANLDKGIDAFRRSLARDPNFPLAHAGLGRALWMKYEQTHEPRWMADARSSCDRAVQLDAKLAVAQVCLGTIHEGLGRHEEAAADFLRAIELDATSDEAYRGLGRAHQALGRPADAEKSFRRAVELHPDYWAGHTYLGSFYFSQSRYGEAATEFERAIELAPDNAAACASLGSIYHVLGRDEEAIAKLRESIQIRPTFKAVDTLGLIYFDLRRYDEAVAAMQRAIRFEGADYIAYGKLARALFFAPGRRPEAAAMFRRAIDMADQQLGVNPWDGDAHIMLASYRAMVGDKEEALAHLRRAMEAKPGDSECMFWAGVIHDRFGERSQALEWLERSIAAGYPRDQVRSAAELDDLRGEPRFAALIATP